jgi:uncharacterized Zn-binding protein involved in type VI secretion
MVSRYLITLGATTTAGGTVISASTCRSINDAAIAREGDKVLCPACSSTGFIALDGPRLPESDDGKQIALSDDLCICKCPSPPRLIASQNFVMQSIDAESHAGQSAAVANIAEKLNATAGRPANSGGIPLLLLDPDTNQPFRHRPYRLELSNRVIEGTTDQHGATRPLAAAEREAVLTWHIGNAAVL